MPHSHRQCAVRTGCRRQPLVGELHVVGVVRRDRDHLLPAVPRLRHPVRVRRPRDRQVRTPHDQVAGVPPVAGLRYVGLVAEHLRRRDRQIGVPVVERQHRPADQRREPGAGRVRHHRHRRNRGEPGDPVRPPFLQRVHVRRRDELGRLVPGRADQPALAARGLVPVRELRVVDDVRPRCHGVAVLRLRLPVQVEQDAADVRVADARGGVGVPGERGAARATAGLVLRLVRTDRRIVGLLGLPGDDAVLDVHLPRARTGAVHAVRRPDHLVVAPAVAVEVVRAAATAFGEGAQVVGNSAFGEVATGTDQSFGQLAVQAHAAPSIGVVRDS